MPEAEKSVKPHFSNKTPSGSSHGANGTLPLKKVPSPTHASNGITRSNSIKKTSDGRPPRPTSKTASDSSIKNNATPKGTKSKAASGPQQTTKPTVKPKPTSTSVASASRGKLDSRSPSRPNSAQTTESHSGVRQPNRPRTPKNKSPVPRLSHSSSVQTTTIITTATATVAKGVKDEEKSASPKPTRTNKVLETQFKRASSDGNKSPANKNYPSKIGSPNISRKQFSSTKSTTMTKSAIKKPTRALSFPVPTKPKPPPVVVPKSSLNKARSVDVTAKASVTPQHSIHTTTVLANEKKGANDSETLVSDQPDQNTCIETPMVTESTLESKEKTTQPNAPVSVDKIKTIETVNHYPTDNSDEDNYDDVVHSPDISSKKNNSIVKSHSAVIDDNAHPVSANVPTESTEKCNELDTNSNDTGIKAFAVSNQSAEEKNDPGHSRSSPIPFKEPQKSHVSLTTVTQTIEEHTTVYNDENIYDDVVVENTMIVSSQEVNVGTGGHVDVSTTIRMKTTEISMNAQSLSASIPGDDKVSKPTTTTTASSHQQTEFNESEALYDDIICPGVLHQTKQDNTVNKVTDEDFKVEELSVSPRQSRVASFRRAGDKDFGYRDSGLGIEAYYDKITHPGDVVEPAFYDQIGEAREQLETISSTEDVLQSESSGENVLVVTDLEAPALPPRSKDMTEEVTDNRNNQLPEASAKVVETTMVESGFEDHFDVYYNDDKATKTASKVKPDPLVISQSNNSPPSLPPRRPHSTQLDMDDIPLRSPGCLSHRASSSSPHPSLPERKSSVPQLMSSPKDFVSSNSSLAPSHSAVSIISGRSEDRTATDGGSDASRTNSLLDVDGELIATEHKKEKSRFSLSFFTRKRSDKRRKTESPENSEQIRPRAASMGQSLHRKKSSRQAMKKKGSLPPEIPTVPSEIEYSLPDPIHFADDKEYDDCTVIGNNWKSTPPDSNPISNNVTVVPLNDAKGTESPSNNEQEEIDQCVLDKNKEIQRSMESLGSFTQNFEDSSGWFDDIYDMVANSTTHMTESSEVKLTITADSEDIYDTVAPDPEKDKLVVLDSPSLNTRSSSFDSSGSFDSLDEDEDNVSPLHSDLKSSIKGNSLPPQHSVRTKMDPSSRPRSYSNINQAAEMVKNLQPTRSLRPIEDITEVSVYKNIN